MCVNCNDSLQVNLPPSVPGPVGAVGPAPNLTATATSVSSSSSPTVTVSGSSPTYNLAFGIPAGVNGTNGTNGIDGEIILNYSFGGYSFGSTNPSTAKIGFNGATAAATNSITVNTTDSTGTSVANIINLIGTSSNPSVKALIKITKKGSSSVYSVFQVTSRVINSGYTLYNVVHLTSSATAIVAGDNITFGFSLVGDKGDTGAAGTFNFPGIAPGAGTNSLVLNNGGTNGANNSIAAGNGNYIYPDATDSFITGTNNTVAVTAVTGTTAGMIVGGVNNTILGPAQYSLITGRDVFASQPSSIYLGTTKFASNGDNQTQFMQLTGTRTGTGSIDLLPAGSSFAASPALSIRMPNNSIWNVEGSVSAVDVTDPTKYATYKFIFSSRCASSTVAISAGTYFSGATPTAFSSGVVGVYHSSGTPPITLTVQSSGLADLVLKITAAVSSGTDTYRWAGNLKIVQLGWF